MQPRSNTCCLTAVCKKHCSMPGCRNLLWVYLCEEVGRYGQTSTYLLSWSKFESLAPVSSSMMGRVQINTANKSKVLILLLLSCAKHGTALFSLSELPKRKATHRCHSFNACCVSSGPAVWFARSTSGADSSTCWSCSDSLDTCLPSLIFASMRYLLDATALCRDEWDWGLQLAVMGSLQGELMAISVRWDHLL